MVSWGLQRTIDLLTNLHASLLLWKCATTTSCNWAWATLFHPASQCLSLIIRNATVCLQAPSCFGTTFERYSVCLLNCNIVSGSQIWALSTKFIWTIISRNGHIILYHGVLLFFFRTTSKVSTSLILQCVCVQVVLQRVCARVVLQRVCLQEREKFEWDCETGETGHSLILYYMHCVSTSSHIKMCSLLCTAQMFMSHWPSKRACETFWHGLFIFGGIFLGFRVTTTC